MEEINARAISDLEQAAAASKTMAGLLASYFRHLLNDNFSRSEALQIVLGYQEWLLFQGKKGQT